jgi:hypothetical protein
MSAIASFILLPKTALSELRQAAVPKKRFLLADKDEYWGYLHRSGRKVSDYQWSGYVFATLLVWLKEEHQTDLMESPYGELAKFLTDARGATHFVLSIEHKNAYLDKLDPATLSGNMLRDYYNAFNGGNEPDAGVPMLDGVRALREALLRLDADSVVLLIIG